jgi:hypothetical protein
VRVISVAIAALTFQPAMSAAQSDRQPATDEIVINEWANKEACNSSNAERVSFAELSSGTNIAKGRCVAVEGFQKNRALFDSVRHAKSRRSANSEKLRGKRVGLYADWESFGDPFSKPERVRVLGLVGECETQWPGAMMLMGYCHYTGGPILLVSELTRLGSD